MHIQCLSNIKKKGKAVKRLNTLRISSIPRTTEQQINDYFRDAGCFAFCDNHAWNQLDTKGDIPVLQRDLLQSWHKKDARTKDDLLVYATGVFQ
jgi:hypothetical protein